MVDGKTLPRPLGGAREGHRRSTASRTCPAPGDALYVGLSEAVPSNAVRLRFHCHIEGVGVDPNNPPLTWEAWNGEDWEPCELDSDTTGGLNRDGDVVLHVPRSHATSLIAKQRAGWLRARVTEPVEGQPAYSASPSITGLAAITIGGTVDAVNAELVSDEEVGISEGIRASGSPSSGSRSSRRTSPPSSRCSGDDGWEEWPEVAGLRRQRARRPPLRARPQLRRGPARARGPAGRRHAPPLRRGARQGRPAPAARVPDRRRPAGQRRGRHADRPQVVDPVRRPGREPAPGAGRRRRRGHRERQGPRARSACARAAGP